MSIRLHRSSTYPTRWHLPVPLPNMRKKPTKVLEGKVEPRAEQFTAPISSRFCAGYEVSVLFDAAGDNRSPM